MSPNCHLIIIVLSSCLVNNSCNAFHPLGPRSDTRPPSSRTSPSPACSVEADNNGRAVHNIAISDGDVDGSVASRLRRGAAALCGAATLLASVASTPSSAWAAAAPPLTENQQLVSDVWWSVTAQYFDPTYNGLTEGGWRAKKDEAVRAVADLGGAGVGDEVRVASAINGMLGALGDPYTRYLPREQYDSLTAYARGGSAGGIGVSLLLDPRSGSVVVTGAADDGPAALAGVRRGDAIAEVDGESAAGASAELIAARCRGEPGEKVEVVVRHGTLFDDDGGKTNEKGGGGNNAKGSKTRTERLIITRATFKVNPVKASTFISSGGQRVGLIEIPAFSQETPGQLADALRVVKSGGSDGDGGGPLNALAVDLRGNVGGYMPAGVDASKLFLAGGRPIVYELDKSGREGAVAYYADGRVGAELNTPLYLLVDGRTASAAEIFAAALQDNRRAAVVGSSRTFGKGRIQNVQSMGTNGSGGGVAVTRARYVTPRGRDLHGVGIAPNKEATNCGPEDSAATCLADII